MRVETYESALLELSRALERPYHPDPAWNTAVVAIATGSRAHYESFVAAALAGRAVGASPVVRALVEANITLRYLREYPVQRARLWHANGAWDRLRLSGRLKKNAGLAERYGDAILSEEDRLKTEEFVQATRQKAMEDGDPHVPKRGAPFPTVAKMVEAVGGFAVAEAYVLGYGPISADTHLTHLSFLGAVEMVHPDGRVTFVPHTEESYAEEAELLRSMAATVFASMLGIASHLLGLGVEDAADRIRLRLLEEGRADRSTEAPDA